MDKKRFQLNKDSEWWFVQDNTIQVNEYGYRDDLTGEDKYRGLKQDLTEQETVDLLNELSDDNRQLKKLLQEAEEEINKLKKSNKQWMESLVNMESED
jgi:hypothetical protein